jgi:hypothetical protein
MWHAWERGETCTGFWWESERKRQLERPRRRWDNGIRMDFGGLAGGGCGMDSCGSGKGQVAGCCECGDEPSGSGATESVHRHLIGQHVSDNLTGELIGHSITFTLQN